MFGTMLPEEEVVNVGIGPYLSVGRSAPGYIKPNVTFDNELKLNIAGIAFEFFHAPGETDDQIFVWLPEYEAFFLEIIYIKLFRTFIPLGEPLIEM